MLQHKWARQTFWLVRMEKHHQQVLKTRLIHCQLPKTLFRWDALIIQIIVTLYSQIKNNKNKFFSISPWISCFLSYTTVTRYCLNIACGLTSILELFKTIQGLVRELTLYNLVFFKHLTIVPTLFILCTKQLNCEMWERKFHASLTGNSQVNALLAARINQLHVHVSRQVNVG